MHYIVACVGSMTFHSIVGDFTSLERSVEGIRAYEAKLKERNPHFREARSYAPKPIEPPDIGNFDEVEAAMRRWVIEGRTGGYIITECSLDPRLTPA